MPQNNNTNNTNDTLQNFIDAGSDIVDSVNRALESGNFNNLSSDIMQSVNRATNPRGPHSNSGPNMSNRTQTTEYRQTNASGQQYYRQTTNTQSYTYGNPNASPYPNGTANGSVNRTANSRQYTQNAAGANSYNRAGMGNPSRPYATPNQNYDRYRGQYSTTTSQRVGQTRPAAQNRMQLTPFVQRNVSKYGGIGKLILGGAGLATFGLATAMTLLATVISFDVGLLVATLIMGGITAGSFFLFRKGMRQQQLSKQFYQYARVIGNRAYIELKDLAGMLYVPTEKVRKTIKEMKKIGYLPQAKLDDTESTLMLTSDVYQQYLVTKQNQLEKEKEEAEKLAREQAMSPEERNIAEMISEGQEYIRKIRKANDAIPDDVMTDKLNRLEGIMRRIFEEVEKRPETASDLRRLMDYYLPTTEKLLQAYISLDAQPVSGENISKTKSQIEDVLDTMNDAFEKLLDSMFEDMAWDVSSDISVMNTMLKQDGLAGETMTMN